MALGCNSGFANQLFDDAESKGVGSTYFEDDLGSNLFEESEEDILVGSLESSKASIRKPVKQTLRASKIQAKKKVEVVKKVEPVKKVKLKAVPLKKNQKIASQGSDSNRTRLFLKRVEKKRVNVKRNVELPEDPITLDFAETKMTKAVRPEKVLVKKVKSKDQAKVKLNEKPAVKRKVVKQEAEIIKEYGSPEVFNEEYLYGSGKKVEKDAVQNKDVLRVTEERDKLLKEREELVALIKEQQDFIDEQAEIYEKSNAKGKEEPLVVQYERAGSDTASKSAAFSVKTFKDAPMPDPLINEGVVSRDYKDEVSAVMGNGYSYKPVDNVSKISDEPTLREQSEYQLLDYVNGMMNTIYTKVGYTTVVILPAGEKLQKVTIGDRQRFNVSTVFDKSSGSWHIYLQPVQMNVTTNMVIATDRHLFNATLGTSDFFKPFAKWINVPGAVESVSVQDGALDLAVKDIDQLNFKYKRSGDTDVAWSPLNIFDDKNNHTFISFDGKALAKYHPVVLTRGIVGDVKLVPYSRYKNTFIIDNVYDNLEVRVDNKSVFYTRKN